MILQCPASSEQELLEAMNYTPLSWTMIRHTLQVTLFITLGRIFDIDSEAFSADVLLKTCIGEIQIFSKQNLKKRKIGAIGGSEPEWLKDYIDKAYQPVEKDFQRLRGELSKRRKVFEQVYRPIRHRLIAHTDTKFIGKADDLWKVTNIGELERILWFLNDLRETLFEIYHNGVRPILRGKNPDVDFFEGDYDKLLDLVKDTNI